MAKKKFNADWASATYSSASDPAAADDGANTGTHGYFRVGDTWFNTTSLILFVCIVNTTSNAIWQPIIDGLSIPNAPTTLLVNDNLNHDLATLTVGAKYKFTLQPALSADGGSPSDYIEGWIKVAAGGGAVTAEGGQPIQSKVPVYIIAVTGKDHLYFMRSVDTAIPCKPYIVREDS